MTDILIPEEKITDKILIIRNQKVILDYDIAKLYQVETKRLNEQVNRNPNRFPKDFMFQLTQKEFSNLKSQIATSSWGGRRTPPYAFTEHGVAMLATILRSKKAIEISILIIRTFVRLRQLISTHDELLEKIESLERDVNHNKKTLVEIYEIVNRLLFPTQEQSLDKPIGFALPTNEK